MVKLAAVTTVGYLAMGADGAGNAAAVYSDGWKGVNLRALHYSANTGAWSKPAPMAGVAGGLWAEASMADDGAAVAVWEQDQAGKSDTYAASAAAGSAAFKAAAQVGKRGDRVTLPVVAAASGGRARAVWWARTSSMRPELLTSRLDDRTGAWSPELLLSGARWPEIGANRYLAGNAEGQALVLFRDKQDAQIHYRMYR